MRPSDSNQRPKLLGISPTRSHAAAPRSAASDFRCPSASATPSAPGALGRTRFCWSTFSCSAAPQDSRIPCSTSKARSLCSASSKRSGSTRLRSTTALSWTGSSETSLRATRASPSLRTMSATLSTRRAAARCSSKKQCSRTSCGRARNSESRW
eukprot:Amastigsp_a12291_12.p3 type:complete len:154 gc:universal Amastigsp_a12291_12:504-43(-)